MIEINTWHKYWTFDLFRPLSHYGACLFCVLFKYALNLPTSGIT